MAAVSVGVPSMVSKDKSFIYSTPNLKGLENIDLGNLLRAYVNIPVFVDRDVNYLLVNDIKSHHLDPERGTDDSWILSGNGFWKCRLHQWTASCGQERRGRRAWSYSNVRHR